METKKIINFMDDSEESKFATTNGMLQTVKKRKVNTIKTVLLNLKQRLLNQVSVTIRMHFF